MSEVTEVLRTFWFDLFNSRSVEEMRELFHPDYEQVDHRVLTASGADRDGWEAWVQTWFDVVPDLAARDLELLGEKGEHVVYLVVFAGHDAVTGGDLSGAFYVLNRFSGGQFMTTELFDDRGAALARFGEVAGS